MVMVAVRGIRRCGWCHDDAGDDGDSDSDDNSSSSSSCWNTMQRSWYHSAYVAVNVCVCVRVSAVVVCTWPSCVTASYSTSSSSVVVFLQPAPPPLTTSNLPRLLWAVMICRGCLPITHVSQLIACTHWWSTASAAPPGHSLNMHAPSSLTAHHVNTTATAATVRLVLLLQVELSRCPGPSYSRPARSSVFCSRPQLYGRPGWLVCWQRQWLCCLILSQCRLV